MDALRHAALGICILTASAGMIHIFWPETAFKPVINAALMLYIVTAVFQMGTSADWPGLVEELRSWTRSEAAVPDYSSYGESLQNESVQSAIREVLAYGGVEAAVVQRDGTWIVIPVRASDAQAAEKLLQQNCSGIPYAVETEGDGR